jgi:hypothetical protein
MVHVRVQVRGLLHVVLLLLLVHKLELGVEGGDVHVIPTNRHALAPVLPPMRMRVPAHVLRVQIGVLIGEGLLSRFRD